MNFDTSETATVTTAGALRLVRTAFLNNLAAGTAPAVAAPLLFGSKTAVVALEGTSFTANDGAPLGQPADSPSEVCRPFSAIQTSSH